MDIAIWTLEIPTRWCFLATVVTIACCGAGMRMIWGRATWTRVYCARRLAAVRVSHARMNSRTRSASGGVEGGVKTGGEEGSDEMKVNTTLALNLSQSFLRVGESGSHRVCGM